MGGRCGSTRRLMDDWHIGCCVSVNQMVQYTLGSQQCKEPEARPRFALPAQRTGLSGRRWACMWCWESPACIPDRHFAVRSGRGRDDLSTRGSEPAFTVCPALIDRCPPFFGTLKPTSCASMWFGCAEIYPQSVHGLAHTRCNHFVEQRRQRV